MATRLFNLSVNEVSLVGKPANNKRFALFKSADEVSVAEPTIEPTEEPAVEVPSATEIDTSPLTLVKADGSLDEVSMAKLDPVLRPQVEALFKAQADAAAARALVEKAASEAVEKAASLERALASEKEAAEVKEAVAKAAVDFSGLPQMVPATFGPALRAVRKADAHAAEVIETVLKSCKALVEQSLEPAGRASQPGIEHMSTWDRVQKTAMDMVAKGEARTKEIAVARLLETDKSLHAAINAEKGQ